MKKLIISCDDLGISEEINLGIKDCFDNGVATSSSIIVNGEFYNHALNEVITNLPTKFYGLHLNLTEGKALSENCVNKICDKKQKKSLIILLFWKIDDDQTAKRFNMKHALLGGTAAVQYVSWLCWQFRELSVFQSRV